MLPTGEVGRSQEADQASHQYDDREWHAEQKERHERDAGKHPGHTALERTPSDAQHGLDHQQKHGALQAEEQSRDHRDCAELGVDERQRQHDDCARDDEQQSGDETADGSMHEPAEIDCELLGLRSWQKVAEIQGVQKPSVADPLAVIDDLAMKQRDLAGGTAKGQAADLEPEARCLP
jgi:hypothetical protein